MLSSQNTQQLYHQLLIHAHILPILDQFIHHLPTPVEVFQTVQTLIIIGMVRQYLVRFLVPMHFLPWISIIMVGSTIPLPSLQPAVALEILISLQFHRYKGRLEPVLIFQDQDHSCILLLLATGTCIFVAYLSGSEVVVSFQ